MIHAYKILEKIHLVPEAAWYPLRDLALYIIPVVGVLRPSVATEAVAWPRVLASGDCRNDNNASPIVTNGWKLSIRNVQNKQTILIKLQIKTAISTPGKIPTWHASDTRWPKQYLTGNVASVRTLQNLCPSDWIPKSKSRPVFSETGTNHVSGSAVWGVAHGFAPWTSPWQTQEPELLNLLCTVILFKIVSFVKGASSVTTTTFAHSVMRSMPYAFRQLALSSLVKPAILSCMYSTLDPDAVSLAVLSVRQNNLEWFQGPPCTKDSVVVVTP